MNIYIKVLEPKYIIIEAPSVEMALAALPKGSTVVATSLEPLEEEDDDG